MTSVFPEHRRYLSIPPSGTRVMFIAPIDTAEQFVEWVRSLPVDKPTQGE